VPSLTPSEAGELSWLRWHEKENGEWTMDNGRMNNNCIEIRINSDVVVTGLIATVTNV
jgi:hypothetical protein